VVIAIAAKAAATELRILMSDCRLCSCNGLQCEATSASRQCLECRNAKTNAEPINGLDRMKVAVLKKVGSQRTHMFNGRGRRSASVKSEGLWKRSSLMMRQWTIFRPTNQTIVKHKGGNLDALSGCQTRGRQEPENVQKFCAYIHTIWAAKLYHHHRAIHPFPWWKHQPLQSAGQLSTDEHQK
jgi:hypothetical protein